MYWGKGKWFSSENIVREVPPQARESELATQAWKSQVSGMVQPLRWKGTDSQAIKICVGSGQNIRYIMCNVIYFVHLILGWILKPWCNERPPSCRTAPSSRGFCREPENIISQTFQECKFGESSCRVKLGPVEQGSPQQKRHQLHLCLQSPPFTEIC